MSTLKRDIAGLDAAGRLLKRADVFDRLASARERFGASGTAAREVARSDRAAAALRAKGGTHERARSEAEEYRAAVQYEQADVFRRQLASFEEARACVASIPASLRNANWAVEARENVRNMETAIKRNYTDHALTAAASACALVRERPDIGVPARNLVKPQVARFMVQDIDQKTGKPSGKPRFVSRENIIREYDDPEVRDADDVLPFLRAAKGGDTKMAGGGAAPLVKFTALRARK